MTTHMKHLRAPMALVILACALAAPCRLSAQLRLEIGSLKPSYMVFEPVFIDISVKNEEGELLKVTPDLVLEAGNVSMFIAESGGKFVQYSPGIDLEPDRAPVVLKPSKSITARQLVLFNAATKAFAFPAAGKYRVRAILHGYGLRPDAESNVLEVRVNAPVGREAEAMKLFADREVAKLVMSLNDDDAAASVLERLMEKYPDTTFGRYAQFYLARRHSREFLTRKPNYERAAELYRGLVEREPSFPLAAEAYFGLGQAYMRIGRLEEAKKSFDAVLEKTQITDLFGSARRLRESLNQR